MNDKQNFTNIGEKILDSVTDALKTGDFSGLNDLVSDTVTSALQEAKLQNELEKQRQRERVKKQYDDWQVHRDDGFKKEWDWRQKEQERLERERIRERQRRQAQRLEQERAYQERIKKQQENRQQGQAAKSLVKFNRVGSVSGILFTVFGGIGLGFSLLGVVVVLLIGLFGDISLGRLIVSLIFPAIFGWMIGYGTSQRKRLSRADNYLRLCSGKMYGVLEDIAKRTGKSVRYVRRDIRKMLQLGFFPEGHVDEKETCFMLNDQIYDQYLQTAEAHRQEEEARKREEEAKNAPKTLAEQVAEEQRAREAELNAMVAEGKDYIRRLRDLNDDIPEESISDRLFQLENLLKEIFDRVKDHPEQMHRMHRLMDYYLPTTVKLVEAYAEFDKVSVPGEDILSAKAEIEKTMGIINQAFKELLNELFQDAAMDATTDAQVLQSMLAREGLTREMETCNIRNS